MAIQGRATIAPDSLLKSFERHLRAENKRPQTIAHYVGATRQFLEFSALEGLPSIENITREHVETWLERLHQDYRPHSVRNRFIGLRIFLKWLLAEGEIERDPTARTRPPQVDQVDKDVVSVEDLRKVFAMLDKGKRWRDALIVAILYDTGLRAGELADLKTEHVNADNGLIYIAQAKNHKTRIVRLSPVGVRYLDRYLRHLHESPEYLLEGKRGKMTRSGVYQVVREIFEQAGVPGRIGPHDLRHTSASHVVGDMSESEMMQLFGWSDAGMARHYAKQALEKAALDAHGRASPLTKLLESK